MRVAGGQSLNRIEQIEGASNWPKFGPPGPNPKAVAAPVRDLRQLYRLHIRFITDLGPGTRSPQPHDT